MSDIVVGYHLMHFQGKRIIQTQENGEKPNFGPDLGVLGLKSGRQTSFLRQSLDVIVNYHHVQHQKNLMIQS